LLRRLSLARAIQGSNSIEGYRVSLDDALAAFDGDEPSDVARETWAAVTGYRDAMTYVMQLSDDPHVQIDVSLLRGLHRMMLRHDLDKRPGLWRTGPIYVVDQSTGASVYEGPDVDVVHELMEELAAVLQQQDGSATVRAAMAHLNLAMIHPFLDGNGRMARALQTLVLAREGVTDPMLCSVEEYLGQHQQAYYDVLSTVGGGGWRPARDTRPWIRFMLTAHYRQALTLLGRAKTLSHLFDDIERRILAAGLPARSVAVVCEAARGAVIRRPTYMSIADVEEKTASRDLKALASAAFLVAEGESRGRVYTAPSWARDVFRQLRERLDTGGEADPFERLEREGRLEAPPGQDSRASALFKPNQM
jgi:Fic family protein